MPEVLHRKNKIYNQPVGQSVFCDLFTVTVVGQMLNIVSVGRPEVGGMIYPHPPLKFRPCMHSLGKKILGEQISLNNLIARSSIQQA